MEKARTHRFQKKLYFRPCEKKNIGRKYIKNI